jgi:hypothetical protein
VDGDGEVGPLALNALVRGCATVLGTHTAGGSAQRYTSSAPIRPATEASPGALPDRSRSGSRYTTRAIGTAERTRRSAASIPRDFLTRRCRADCDLGADQQFLGAEVHGLARSRSSMSSLMSRSVWRRSIEEA